MCGRTRVVCSFTSATTDLLHDPVPDHYYPMLQDLYNDDVGNAALFLTSDLSRVITGTTM